MRMEYFWESLKKNLYSVEMKQLTPTEIEWELGKILYTKEILAICCLTNRRPLKMVAFKYFPKLAIFQSPFPQYFDLDVTTTLPKFCTCTSLLKDFYNNIWSIKKLLNSSFMDPIFFFRLSVFWNNAYSGIFPLFKKRSKIHLMIVQIFVFENILKTSLKN